MRSPLSHHIDRSKNRVVNFQEIIKFERKRETEERMQEMEVI